MNHNCSYVTVLYMHVIHDYLSLGLYSFISLSVSLF